DWRCDSRLSPARAVRFCAVCVPEGHQASACTRRLWPLFRSLGCWPNKGHGEMCQVYGPNMAVRSGRTAHVRLANTNEAARNDTMVSTSMPVAVSVAGARCRHPLGWPLKTAGAWSPPMNVDPAPNPIVAVGKTRFGNGLPLALIAGPCALESREHALQMASALKKIAGEVGIGLVYKTSFDKANRTSAKSNRGVGLDRAL